LDALNSAVGAYGSAVSSFSWIWGGDPVEIEFDAF